MKRPIFLLMVVVSAASHAEITTDGTLGPSLELSGPDFEIGAELGQQYGNNLFHSFQDFNIHQGESATFSGPESVNNVISRVTGGNPSEINGTLRSTLPQADIYLVNPAGMVFGEHAQLDVPGGFHASAADSVKFSDGAEFHASPSQNSTFTSATPAAFGFTDAPVKVESGKLAVAEGKTLTLSGGALHLRDAELSAPAGSLRLETADGEINLQNSTLSTSGEGGGAVLIRGGRFVLDNSMVSAETQGEIDGQDIQIQVSELTATNGSEIVSTTSGAGKGGAIQIETQRLELNEGVGISVINKGTGAGGNIHVQADSVTLRGKENSSSIISQSAGNGKGGDILIQSKHLHLDLSKNGGIMSFSQSNGAGGDITIQENETVNVHGGGDDNRAMIVALTEGTGQGGNIQITTSELNLQNKGYFGTLTIGLGNGGVLQIDAEYIILSNSLVSGGTDGAGDGGGIILKAQQISLHKSNLTTLSTEKGGRGGEMNIQVENELLLDDSNISSTTFGTSNSGNIIIQAGSVKLKGNHNYVNKEGKIVIVGSGILAHSMEDTTGNAGNLSLSTSRLELQDNARISSNTGGTGMGGMITLRIHGDAILTDSWIEAGTLGKEAGSGNAGSIDIEAENVSLLDGAGITIPTGGSGHGGNLQLKATGKIALLGNEQDTSAISAASASIEDDAGNAGSILLEASELLIEHGGIDASTLGKGQGGSIKIHVNGPVSLRERSVIASNAGYTKNAGASGDIEVIADSLTLAASENGLAGISATTSSPADAGNISIQVTGPVILDGWNAGLLTRANNWGEITPDNPVYQQYLRIVNGVEGSFYSNAEDLGNAGNIRLEAGELNLRNGAAITSTSDGAGQGGQITLRAKGPITLSGHAKHPDYLGVGSYISTDSNSELENAGNGGTIDIQSTVLHVLDGANITADTEGPGQGGNILIHTGELLISGETFLDSPIAVDPVRQSIITTLSFGHTPQSGKAGDIEIQADTIRLETGGEINAQTQGIGNGAGGNIKIRASGSLTLAGEGNDADESSIGTAALGEGDNAGNAGSIEIQAAELHIEKGARIVASTQSRGAGGDVRVDVAGTLRMSGESSDGYGSAIQSNSLVLVNAGQAGDLTVSAGRIELADKGGISARTEGADGGNIRIETPGYVYLSNDSRINTSVKAAQGNGGNITLLPEFIILDNSDIIAHAYKGQGGNIHITTNSVFRLPPEQESVIDASSQLGIDGQIVITAPDVDLTSALFNPAINFLEATPMQACRSRDLKDLCRFTVRRHAISPSPTALRTLNAIARQEKDE